MRSTFFSKPISFLFGLNCLLGSASADTASNAPNGRSGPFLAPPESIVMIESDGSQNCVPLVADDLTCSGDAIDTDGDGIFDASSSERRMGELDCKDPRLAGCTECLGTVRTCCPSQECTVSNCPGDSKYCPNDKGGGSHCC